MSDNTGLVIVGAGMAGVAAAWSARTRVTLVDGGAGATSFMSGALDRESWEAPATESGLDASVTDFLNALGGWDLPSGRPAWLATVAGRIRPARGCDAALLDLGAIAGRRVLVPRAARTNWDADALVRSWNAEAAQSLGLRFEAIDSTLLRWDDERRIADGELAMRHDEAARLSWLADRLRPAIADRGGKDGCAVLLGPWLGADRERATELSRALGVPIGEALSGTAGSSGLRFESARARLLRAQSAGSAATIVRGRVAAIELHGDSLAISFTDERPSLRASAAVLAMGGLVGGGIAFDPPEGSARHDGPIEGGAAYRVSMRIAPELLARGAFRLGGSIHGPVLDETAWPKGPKASALEAAGLLHDDGALSARLFAAGDVLAGERRTVAAAVASGVRAGRKAASVASVDDRASGGVSSIDSRRPHRATQP